MTCDNFFSAKRILVTGASSGLGMHIADELSAVKAALIITGRNKEKLFSLSEKWKIANPNFHGTIPADLSQAIDIHNLADLVEPLDGLVLNAGVIDYTPAKMISQARINSVFKVNVESSILLIQALLKKKKILPGASVVVISSIAALLGVPGTALYAASKAALSSYARVLASEVAPQMIRVNVVSPGIIRTELIGKKDIVTTDHFAKLEAEYPLGFRMPGDVSNLVMFLLSDKARWITGSNIVIDGGHTLH